MIERIAEGRTDLVFDFVGAGNPATTKDSQGTSLIRWCAYDGDVSAIRTRPNPAWKPAHSCGTAVHVARRPCTARPRLPTKPRFSFFWMPAQKSTPRM